jgi:3-oxoacyl-[acyl-carrier protein] reductase
MPNHNPEQTIQNETVFPRPLALVTGASRGTGYAIAKKLAKEGYDLVLTCREKYDLLLQLKDCLTEQHSGISVQAVKCDVSSFSDVSELFRSLNRLDVLVNNAGIACYGLVQDMECEAWDTVIGTNLSGVFYTCRQAIPLMLAGGSGRIINISSVWGITGASCEAAYSASKGGVNAFTKALGKELAPSGIAVNALALGVVDTDMNARLDPEEKEALRQEIPADRFCTPSEAADAAAALLKMPVYFTGQVITLDGGFI